MPWTWTGVHHGLVEDDTRDVMGYRPTGRTIELRGVTIVSDREATATPPLPASWTG